MTSFDHYRFADLHARDELLNKMARLESEFTEELGRPVTLIAYTPRHSAVEEAECRAGLND